MSNSKIIYLVVMITLLKKIYKSLKVQPEKFYSDYSPLEKAYWGLWVRPKGDIILALKLNKALLSKMNQKKD